MYAISTPCHHCGHDNPADALNCAVCQAVIRQRPTTTTQLLKPTSHGETPGEELIREAYLVASHLIQYAHRLRALLDAEIGKR